CSHRYRSASMSFVSTADSGANPDPLCQWNNSTVRLIDGYVSDITVRTSRGNNRTIHFQFFGCIGSRHCASSRHLRRREDLAVNSFHPRLGALRSNISLSLPTYLLTDYDVLARRTLSGLATFPVRY